MPGRRVMVCPLVVGSPSPTSFTPRFVFVPLPLLT
jgi:hypothetical protein